jgi:hypothetical protein
MKRNTGLRAIFIIFWVIGSIFWVLIGALDGNFVRSVIYIAIGWAIILTYLSFRDTSRKKEDVKIDS